MLPLGFFRRRSFSAANATNGLLYAAFAATLFFVSLFFQNVKGSSALETAASWLTICVPFFVVAPFGGRIAKANGARTSVAVGALLGGVGTLGFTRLGAGSPFLLARAARADRCDRPRRDVSFSLESVRRLS